MAQYSGVYKHYEGTELQCNGIQLNREITWVTDVGESGAARFKDSSGNIHYLYPGATIAGTGISGSGISGILPVWNSESGLANTNIYWVDDPNWGSLYRIGEVPTTGNAGGQFSVNYGIRIGESYGSPPPLDGSMQYNEFDHEFDGYSSSRGGWRPFARKENNIPENSIVRINSSGLLESSALEDDGTTLTLNLNNYKFGESSQHFIQTIIPVKSVTDNVATSIFRIATTTEVGNTSAGAYTCNVKAIVVNGGNETVSHNAAKSFCATFAHVTDSNADANNTSAITEVYESQQAAAQAASRSVDTITMSVIDNPYYQDVQFTIDVSGTLSADPQIFCVVELLYIGYLTAPTITPL